MSVIRSTSLVGFSPSFPKTAPRCMPTSTPQSPYPMSGVAYGRTAAAKRVSAAMELRVPAARADSSVMHAKTAPPALECAGGRPSNVDSKPEPKRSKRFSVDAEALSASLSFRTTRPRRQLIPTAFFPTAQNAGSSQRFGATPSRLCASLAGWYPNTAASSRLRSHSRGISSVSVFGSIATSA